MTDFGAYVQIMVTERCNLKCVHCAVPEEDSPVAEELATADWIRFIEVIADSGTAALTISGGEATLRSDTPELLAYAAARLARVTLLTNGLVRRSMLERVVDIQGHNANVGIHVSLDGASPRTHDLVRGHGAFRATLGRLELLRALGGRITGIHTVFHQENLGEYDDLVALVAAMGADVWTVFPVAALGRARNPLLRGLTEEQWAALTESLGGLRASHRIDVGQMGPVLEDDWPSSLGVVPNGRESVSRNVVVGPDGAVFTCPPLRAEAIGRVHAGYSVDDWQRSLRLGERVTEKICGSCKFRLLCTGIDADRPFRPITSSDPRRAEAPEWIYARTMDSALRTEVVDAGLD